MRLQPCAVTKSSCSRVSTPSCSALKPIFLSISMSEPRKLRVYSSLSAAQRRLLSTLTFMKSFEKRRPMFENSVPKSSIDRVNPASLSSFFVFANTSESLLLSVSVNSMLIMSIGTPYFERISLYVPTTSGVNISYIDMLTSM